ncbi:MAG: CopG family transcriptional regulator [Acidimicrobiales bacterium]
MATKKVSVTLESTAIERARTAVGSRGLSSYLDAALQEKLERDERRQAFLEHLEELEDVDPTCSEDKCRASRRAARLRAAVGR